MKNLIRWMMPLAAVAALTLGACSDDEDGGTMPTDDEQGIEVTSGQTPDNGSVMIQKVVADQDGWVVIHRDNGNNGPQVPEIIGKAQVSAGSNTDVSIMLDETVSDGEQLWAMLHVDDGQTGEYEFNGAGTPDQPVTVDGDIVMVPFAISQTDPSVMASDQTPSDNSVNVGTVNTPEDGFIVIHASDAQGAPGTVIGQTAVSAGSNSNVVVELSSDAMNAVDNGDKLWAMLHYDRGTEGEYEFPGPDVPAMFDGNIVMMSFTVSGSTPPSVSVSNQAVSEGKVTIASANVSGPAWVVIHRDNGADAPTVPAIIGRTRLNTGTNTEVTIDLTESVSSGDKLWAMLHTDIGVVGSYEFPTSDPPVTIGAEIVMQQFIVQ